ncbi:transposase, partial [Haloferula sp. A504]|uniref:transposase n=1 Tax=Haloferula sp. A504 TaxID=3373601 RepID=UPI0031C82D08|nr:hypothetical protein [Verrucomicrobiaceae bacterium E54]
HGWRVHAWVLMGNHFHLLLETPEPNLVTGMKWLLGTFSQGWNARRARRGHVFQGRYKSIPVTAGKSSPYYFRIVADYIHLNPARAGLAEARRGGLASYKWSSLPYYAKGREPEWLVTQRVLRAFELAEDGRGRRAYVSWLEARVASDGGRVDEAAMKALRRGWYLGEPDFADKLRALVEGKQLGKVAGRDHAGRAHDAVAAEELAKKALECLGLPQDAESLSDFRKGDRRKVLVALLLRRTSSVGNGWLAERLAMGHPSAVSRLVSSAQKQPKNQKELRKLAKMLKCST